MRFNLVQVHQLERFFLPCQLERHSDALLSGQAVPITETFLDMSTHIQRRHYPGYLRTCCFIIALVPDRNPQLGTGFSMCGHSLKP